MTHITTKTKLVILLGNPLGHSLSPIMHNHLFSLLGLNFHYLPVEVKTEDLKTVFAGLIKMNVSGFNVTVPHKINIMGYLDKLDPLAETIGAVNTICLHEGKSIGYNTDGDGFITSLQEESSVTVKGTSFFIVGCGGAVRGIAMTLAYRGAKKIYVTNRTLSKADNLAQEINSKISPCAEAVEQEKIWEKIALCDVVINGTSIGMHPHDNELPIDPTLLPSGCIVADIVYNPLKTRLLKEAEKKGCQTVSGLGMLIYQGAAGFKLWTGKEPDTKEMKSIALQHMSKQQR